MNSPGSTTPPDVLLLELRGIGKRYASITDVRPLISRRYAFEDSLEASGFAASAPTGVIKVVIESPPPRDAA